ncbi:MAG: hypothetical protein QHJ82_01710 [Verrucomicrobiota bacterium]|nr:hypothetical protein [Verrucomicrobiota bacterium]
MRTICLHTMAAIALTAVIAGCVSVRMDNFDKATVGSLPRSWAAGITGTGEPKWSVEKDESAPSGSFVLKQSAWTPKPSFPLCIKSDVTLKDGFVEVKFKPMGGTNDQAGGVVWRYLDANNYYIARANALEDNVVLYKVEKGKRKALDIVGRVGGYGVKVEVPKQQWSTLRVEFAGSRFRVVFNGKELFAVEDSTFPGPGKVGLWTKADSVTVFDDLRYGVVK